MNKIRTVLGDIEPRNLGVTNAHEHVLLGSGLVLLKEPDFRLDDPQKSIEELQTFRSSGGRAIVDAAPIGFGRDPDGLATVSKASGIHIIATTGFHKASYYLDSHWRFHYTPEEIAGLLVDDIEQGMEVSGYEGPLVRRNTARAGAIKVASGYQNIDARTRRAFEAAAMAHKQTGAPILTHTEIGTMGHEQVSLLQSLGVEPRHVILSHLDRNPDPFLHAELAGTGAFLEYDTPGRIKYAPESTVVNLLRQMFDRGLGKQILLGGDTARRSYWKAYGGGPGLAYVTESFAPRLLKRGFTQTDVHQILVENPARALAFAAD